MSEIEVVARSSLHIRSDRLFYRISVGLTHMATDQHPLDHVLRALFSDLSGFVNSSFSASVTTF